MTSAAAPPGTGQVRSVLADLAPQTLGAVNYHEHLFQVTPLLAGEDLTDENLSGQEARSLAASGFSTMVDATPTALGRNPSALARISSRTGITIVATSGAHRGEHYAGEHWLLAETEQALAQRFHRDVTSGMQSQDSPDQQQIAATPDGRPVRAGMLKAGIGYWSISAFERRVLAAVATVHHQTGAPVMVHLEHGSAAFEVLDVLGGHGVPAQAVVLAHIDRNPDAGLHAELAARGAYLGYDGAARHQRWPDSVLLSCLVETAARGATERILLGGDVARRSRYLSYGGLPGMAYLGERFVPRLRQAGGEELTQAVLYTNPQRLLGVFEPEPHHDRGGTAPPPPDVVILS